jgi:hypothetical protein
MICPHCAAAIVTATVVAIPAIKLLKARLGPVKTPPAPPVR